MRVNIIAHIFDRALHCDAACGQIPKSVKKQAVTNIVCWLIAVMPLVKVKGRNESTGMKSIENKYYIILQFARKAACVYSHSRVGFLTLPFPLTITPCGLTGVDLMIVWFT